MKKNSFAIVCVTTLLVVFLCFAFFNGVKLFVDQYEQPFDTSTLTSWCGSDSNNVRMVGAWFYDSNMVEDETGNVWAIEQEFEKDDFLLLWIDSMGTSAVEDDEVIKVWREVC